jgi:hypothetical protein
MARAQLLILIALVVAAIVGFDLVRTIRTGRGLPNRITTTVTRKQPQRFRRYLYGDWIVLAFCAALILWALIRPETFGR